MRKKTVKIMLLWMWTILLTMHSGCAKEIECVLTTRAKVLLKKKSGYS